MLGSEGFFGKLSPWGSVLGHCIVDVLSKNVGNVAVPANLLEWQ
jgi:hypothetical protein